MNRLSLTLGLAAMDLCWIYLWSVLIGLWADAARPRALLSPPSVFALLVLGALCTQALGRRARSGRGARAVVAGLGVLAVLIAVRADQYATSRGLDWLTDMVGALATLLGQPGRPALAFGLGVYLWLRGVRLGSQSLSYLDAEGGFRWGIGRLVAAILILALTTRPSVLASLEAQTSPFVVGFFFASLLTLALGRLESLRTRTRALAINTQWLGVLIGVAGLVVLAALAVGQMLSFDVLLVATRPLFDLLGLVVLVAIYIVVIPLAFVIEWLIYLVLSLVHDGPPRQPPQPPQPSDIDNLLQRLLSQGIPPDVLAALKALGSGAVLVLALLIVARAAARWRPSSNDADATDEERDSLWQPGRVRRVVLDWLRRVFGRRARTRANAGAANAAAALVSASLLGQSSIRDLYRQLLVRGESAGARRAPATTPLEHLPSLQRSLEPAEDVARLTRAYVDVRYAETEPSPDEARALGAGLDQVRPLDAKD